MLVAVTVTNVNFPPVLSLITNKVIAQGQTLQFLVMASDPDGTMPNLTAENLPTNASFIDSGDGTGTFEFNPDGGQLGVYVVRIIASDGDLPAGGCFQYG